MIRSSLFSLLIAGLAAAEAPAEVKLTHVKGNVRVIDGAIDRIGVSAGPDGVLLIDGGYMNTLPDVRKSIASLGRGKATTLINTHWHHSFANAGFADATIIAHRNVARRMAKPNMMFNRIVPASAPGALPDVSFDDRYSLTFNGERIDVIGFAPAHTDSDAIVIFRNSGVVFTGDLFVPHIPWIDYGSGGSVGGFLAAVDRLVEIVPADALLVPGHGETSRYADLLAYRSAMHELVQSLKSKIAAGARLEQIQKEGVPPALARWVNKDGIPLTFVLESFYKGLSSPEPGDNCEFVNGRWFDGERFVPSAGLWSEDGKLTAKRPATVQCAVDLGDKFVIPPFAEAHTHELGNEETFQAASRKWINQGIFYAMVQDAGRTVPKSLRAMASAPQGLEAMYTQGVVTSAAGVIPDFYRLMADRGMLGEVKRFEEARDNLFFTIDSLAELQRKWPLIQMRNDRFVKVMLAFSEEWDKRRRNRTSYDAKPPRYSKKPGLNPALLRPLIVKAHAAGLKVSVHIETAADFRLAVASGADYIAHLPGAWQIGERTGFPSGSLAPWMLNQSDAEEAKRRDVNVITTSVHALGDPEEEAFKTVHRHNLRLLADAGVTLMTGSDTFGRSVADEVRYLGSLEVVGRAKLLDIATRVTPQAMYLGRKIGELKPDFEATFIAFDQDPMSVGESLTKPVLKVKSGTLLP